MEVVAEAVVEPERRLALVRQFGTFTQAYSTAVQAELKHFWHDDCYLAYAKKWGVACVLADPVGTPELHEPLLREFLNQFRKTCFWQIGRHTATLLAKQNFWINELGCDTRIDLADYSFAGRKKERLRHATNWLAKHNFTVCEGTYAKSVDLAEVRRLSETWQTTRQTKRLVHFFNRPLVLEDEPDVRKFFLTNPQGKIVAFVFWDPIYRDGKVIGYSPAVKRRLPDAPLRAEEGITKFAIEQFQQEGVEHVMLGLSPLAGIEDKEYRANPLIHMSWSRGMNAWWVNRYFYNLKGHADFKRRFYGVEEQTYYASDCLFNDFRVIASLRLAGAL